MCICQALNKGSLYSERAHLAVKRLRLVTYVLVSVYLAPAEMSMRTVTAERESAC